MDNKESVIKSIVEESNNTIKSTVFRGRSSSILKQPNVQNEAKNNPSTRRVSFSSNYIKTFTTDTEKNTIWDTTVEELLSAAESSNSREGHDLNTTLFNGKGNESEQGESESSEDDFSRDRASTKNSADISLMEFTCVNSTLHSNVAKPDDPTNTSGSSPDNSVTMDFTCVDPSFHSKSGNQSTCSQSTNTEDSSVSMEFTCVNPTFPLKSGNQSTTTEDSSISMEFTCVNPTFHSKPGNQSTYSQSTITKDSSVSMELTCVNPIFHSNTKQKPADTSESVNTSHTAKIQDLGNTSVSMEFTCVNPIFHLNNEKKQADTSESFNAPHTAKIHNPENTSVPMELTCVNPTFHSSTKKDQVDTFNASRTAEIQNPGDTSLSMEFTCVNPTLPLNTKQATGLFNTPHTDKIQNPENTSVSMEFTCVNPTLHLNTKKTAESFNAPHTAKIQNPGNTSVSMEFTCVNPTLHSNCNDGKGANIPLKKSPNKFESYALADKSNTAEFLLRNYQDKTNLSNFSMLDCSKGISLMASVAQTSTQASFNVSPQIDKDQTVDMPSMSLPDITLSSIQPAPTLPVSIGNLQIENGTTKLNQAVDLASSDSEIDKSIAQMNDFSKEESSDLESILQTQSSKSSTLDLLCKSNIDFSAMSTVDDTLQLLRDASQLNRTKTALNNTSGTQLNKTYLVEDSRLEDTKDSTFQDNNSDMHETHPEDHIDLFSKCAEISGNNYILDRNTIELIENSTDGSLLSASDNSKEQEDKIDDFKEVTTPKSVSDNNAVHSAISGSEYMVQSPESDRLTVVTSKKGEPKTTEEILRGDFSAADFLIVRQRDMLILKEKLQSIVIDSSLPVDDWKKHIPTLEKLKEQSLRNRKIIAEKYDKFKKQLKDAIETCEKNKFVPEKLPEDDDVIESDELENILPAKRGIVEKIEEKSKICDNSWKMIKMEDGIAVFTSFFDQMKITVEYCQSDYRVSGIETKSLLTDKAKPAGILIQREFLRLLSPTLINNSIGRQYNILSLLDYIQMTMDKIRKCYKTFKDLVATHDMQISKDFKVKFFLLDEYSIIKWDFCIDLSDLDKITKESISVSASIGKVNAKHVLDLVSQCPKGLGFLESFIMKVEEYLETLRKRKRMLKLRKIQRVCEE
ncbi:dentin sialophosphoprotein-like isoform X7 [Coccinella septempunctata]|uniref:dentin sialophosphoprotein-like isoform X7 n=1 Tax=Coccinella septempunctata TaxID=41139 RepID=UPI001D07D6A9|nr:dentin sialophosphoprotein-like isoform X7 [Coccinella septempunctata]